MSEGGGYLERHAAAAIREAMADTRVVLVNGARQSGKSTLVRRVGDELGASWYTLDNAETRAHASRDPSSFVRLDERMIVDEVQRDPELLLSMKELVDAEPVPGRFLLTGSARVLGLRRLPDTLVGRMETIELWPFSQGEIDRLGTAGDGFVDAAFRLGPQLRHDTSVTRDEVIARVARGGFPDAVTRLERRRTVFLQSYVADLIDRDVTQLSSIERRPQLRALVQRLAATSGAPLSKAGVGSGIGLDGKTTGRYLGLLEEVFLIKTIPAWTRRISSRAVGQPKVAFVDSGVATAVLNQTATGLRRLGAPLGGLLEGFVAMEIARQLTWSHTRATMSHYRTKDGAEVDIVLETPMGQIVGVEVKATSTPRPEDFRGLRHLAERVGDDFLAGYVLHTGDRTLPAGDKLRSIPIPALWKCSG